MNRQLADTLGFINGLLAIAILVVCAYLGYAGGLGAGNKLGGLLVGSIAGLGIAGSICGLIAFLVLIEGHLRTLAGAGVHPIRSEPRFEPRL